MQTQPRIIRVGKAHEYMGMCKDVFAQQIRPHLTEIRVGIRGRGFDRLELDRVADEWMEKNIVRHPIGNQPCKASTKRKNRPIGTSTKSIEASEFAAALAKAKGRKQKQ
jgi:hypothetical protein